MDLTFLTNYAVPIIVGICVCVGYILKNIITSDVINKYIPLIMAGGALSLTYGLINLLLLKYYLQECLVV